MRHREAGPARRGHLPRRRLRPRRELLSARVRAALGLGVVLSVGVTGTFAYWTDAVTVSGTALAAGSIELKADDSDALVGYTTLNLSTMVPGSSVAGVLTIANAGTAPLKYTATSTATNGDGKGLRGSLVVKVTGDASVTGTSPSMTCAGAALSGAQVTLDGPLLATGRLLAAGAAETVCIEVTLDPAAASTLQGAATDVVLTFTATSDLLS